jgi:hypothetical protein
MTNETSHKIPISVSFNLAILLLFLKNKYNWA